MAVEIRMPALSQTTNEVKLIEWLVDVGDVVKKGDSLCRVETDKVTMDVESFESGKVLELCAAPNSLVETGKLIALIGEKVEHVSKKVQVKDYSQRSEMEADAEQKRTEHEKQIMKRSAKPAVYRILSQFDDSIRATSLVKNIAIKRGMDLSRVKGTGPRGLITKKDLEGHTIKAAIAEEKMATESNLQRGEIVLSSHQVGLGRVLTHSAREAPHYYVKTRCFLERFLELREKHTQPDGEKYSFDSLFLYSVARVLRQFPRLNGTLKGKSIRINDHVNVAFAISVGEDLYAPVVRDADRKTISEIDSDIKVLTEKVRNSKLAAHDLSGATFTVSNLGMYEIDEFCAIISPPQSGILSIGRMRKMFHIDEHNRIVIRMGCTLSGSFDHRTVNGATAARFMGEIKEYIEEKLYK
jgi:pyruvate dehydrogenase E2 component (dihydrolipoamide acetyltransferase)